MREGDPVPSTRWSRLEALADASEREREELLNQLVSEYWRPVYAYLCRHGCRPQDAEDLAQGFFTDWLGKRSFEGADPTRGRFRSYLLTSLRHFVINEDRAAKALRRRPPGELVEVEAADGAAAGPAAPDEAFHRAWVRSLVLEVLERLREEYRDKGQELHCELFEEWHVRPNLYGDERPSAEQLFERHGPRDASLRDAKDVNNRIGSAKRAFARLLEGRLAPRVESAEELEAERGDVLAALHW